MSRDLALSPPPWSIHHLDFRCIVDADGNVVADVRSWRDGPDNARLLAAANDLYEALEMMQGIFDMPVSRRRIDNEYATEARKACSAALAKVRGESS